MYLEDSEEDGISTVVQGRVVRMERVAVSDLGWCSVAVIHVSNFEATEIKAIGSRVGNHGGGVDSCFLILSCVSRHITNPLPSRNF